MNIVAHITNHIQKLESELSKATTVQKKQLKITTLGFFYHLPDFEAVVNKHFEIVINKNQLIADILSENTLKYQQVVANSYERLDEYAEEYEALSQNEIFILSAFENAIYDPKDIDSLVGLFIGIIDVLDYIEQFSENPEFWNDLLAKEVNRQNEILLNLKLNIEIDTQMYCKDEALQHLQKEVN